MRAPLCVSLLVFSLVPILGLAGTHLPELVRFEGFLRDASGNDITGAEITLRSVRTGQELAHFQSKGGGFRFWYTPVVDRGPYELHFEASRFEPRTISWPLANWPSVILQASKTPQW